MEGLDGSTFSGHRVTRGANCSTRFDGELRVGINLDSNFRIAGYRPVVFKQALHGFTRTESPTNLIDLKSVFPLRRDGAIVFEECLDRGLIDAEALTVTEIGEVIAARKRDAGHLSQRL
jgi:hypothetical protein